MTVIPVLSENVVGGTANTVGLKLRKIGEGEYIPLIGLEDTNLTVTNPITLGDISIATALPTGSNTIGAVTISGGLPTGVNIIGRVSLSAALPTGANTIGAVTLASGVANIGAVS